MRNALLLLAGLSAFGCNRDVRGPDDSDDPEVTGCRAGAPAAGPKVVPVSHPYDADGDRAEVWELLSLDDGALSTTGVTFEMGRGMGGRVAWAPDGSLAAAVQDDGTLGVFQPDGTVVEVAWDASEAFYASDVAFDATGETLYVVDGNWVENGGGIYEVAVDCDTGAPSLVGKLVDSKLGEHLLGDVLVGDAGAAAVDLAGGELGAHVGLFDYEDAIVGGADRRGDTLYVGDFSEFSGTENRVAIATVDGGVTKVAEVELLDPYAIAAVDGGAIVSSGYGDAIVALDAGGVIDELGSELPGALAKAPGDVVLVTEVSGVRLVRLDGRALVEVDFFATGDGLDGMVGSIGVAP